MQSHIIVVGCVYNSDGDATNKEGNGLRKCATADPNHKKITAQAWCQTFKTNIEVGKNIRDSRQA